MQADKDVIEIPSDLLEEINTPSDRMMWSSKEKKLLKQLFPTAAENKKVRILARRWEELTGRYRSYNAINNKAQQMGLSGGGWGRKCGEEDCE